MLPCRPLADCSRNILVTFLLVCWASPSAAEVGQLDEGHAKAVARLTAEFEEADKTLNIIYKELRLRLDDDRGKFRLQEVQRAWISYRDKECKFVEEIALSSKDSELAVKRCLLEFTRNRATELEKVERQVNPDPVIVPGEGTTLSWPKDLGITEEGGVACLSGAPDLQRQIEDRLGASHLYTTACQITELLFVLLARYGGNSPLAVLDLTRRGGPIQLRRAPEVERILKDKSGTLHIVVGGSGTSLGVYGSTRLIYSTKTWEWIDLARQVGIDNGSGFLECPEKGGYGYETMKQVLGEKHRYEDQNGDGFEDIVVETVETSCSTHKSRTSEKVFLATDNGFMEAAPLQPSRKSGARPRRP